jgi:hypothetical protein
VLETLLAQAVGEGDEFVLDADHLVGHVEPAERVPDDLLVLFFGLPECGFLTPDAAHHVALFGFPDGRTHRVSVFSQRRAQPLVDAGEQGVALGLDGLEERVEGVDEGGEAVLLELLGHGLQVDADLCELTDEGAALVQALFQSRLDAAVVADGRVGRGRDGVDRLGADEVIDVKHVGVVGVLRPRRGPEAPLHLRALRLQRREALAVEYLLELLVGELRVGDGRPAAEAFEPLLLFGRRGVPRLVFEVGVDGRVHARDEEAGDRGDAVDVLPLGRAPFEPPDEGFRHLLVVLDGEDHRDVDVDAAVGRLLDGRQSLLRRGDFNHHVLAPDALEQPRGLVYRPLRVVGELGADFEADVAVEPAGLVVDRLQGVGGVGDVFDDEVFVNLAHALARLDEPAQLLVVVGRAGDGLLEDGRVRGDAAQVVLLDLLPQVAGREHGAADVVVPD